VPCDDGNSETTGDYCQGGEDKWAGLCLGRLEWCFTVSVMPARQAVCTEFLYNSEEQECYYRGLPEGTPCEGGACWYGNCILDGMCETDEQCGADERCVYDQCYPACVFEPEICANGTDDNCNGTVDESEMGACVYACETADDCPVLEGLTARCQPANLYKGGGGFRFPWCLWVPACASIDDCAAAWGEYDTCTTLNCAADGGCEMLWPEELNGTACMNGDQPGECYFGGCMVATTGSLTMSVDESLGLSGFTRGLSQLVARFVATAAHEDAMITRMRLHLSIGIFTEEEFVFAPVNCQLLTLGGVVLSAYSGYYNSTEGYEFPFWFQSFLVPQGVEERFDVVCDLIDNYPDETRLHMGFRDCQTEITAIGMSSGAPMDIYPVGQLWGPGLTYRN
jgi:hypothetical protein